MQVHYSAIALYKNCHYQYKLRYIDELDTIFNCDPQNALTLGTALHKGAETDVETAIRGYYDSYPVIRDAHVTEAMKLEYWIPKLKAMVPEGEHEVYFETPDYAGTIDLLVPIGKGMWLDAPDGPTECDYYDIYDFKYSNNIDGYIESPQLHLYKHFFEQANPGKRIRNLYFVFVPKSFLRQKFKNKTNKRDETIYEFRKRVMKDLETKEIQIKQVQYDSNKVIDFLMSMKHCIEDTEFTKNPTRLCDWCNYKSYCEKGIDYMILPENKRRQKVLNTDPDMWIYADSYVGKSTFIDQIDNVLFANTDGNIGNITSPVVRITDEVIKNGRMTTKKFAWEKFLELVDELEKKENDFKVIALDLLEDLYEHCRLYMYDKLGVEHEQDAGFGKGWDMVRTEFCSTIKRLKNLGYRIIYISKELKTEVNLKNGAKITSYAPNLPDKVANILAGTVTLTVRAFMNNRGRFLQLAKEENIFGGGRFNFVNDTCPLDMKAFIEELKLAQGDVKEESVEEKFGQDSLEQQEADEKRAMSESSQKSEKEEDKVNKAADEKAAEADSGMTEDKPKRRTRKKREE